MINLVLIVTAFLIILDFLLIIFWIFRFKEAKGSIGFTPKVSIMLAVRNEEENLVDCLDSLVRLNYPTDKLEVLVGNDGSTDRSREIIEAYTVTYPWFKLIDINEKICAGNGKANVLAHLTQVAKGDFFFFTDADISVPQNWLWGMLHGVENNVGLVTGTSVVEGTGFLADYQRIDWLFATGMLKVVSDLGIAVTSMGNNMMVSEPAYWKSGGFQKLDFSVTEDLELFKKVSKSYEVVNLFGPEVLNVSKPVSSWGKLLAQRKRWMQGAFGLHPLMIALLLAQTTGLVFFILLLFLSPVIGGILLLVHLILRFVFVYIVAEKVNRKVNLISSFVFELVNTGFMFVSLIYYLFSGPVQWKGRKY